MPHTRHTAGAVLMAGCVRCGQEQPLEAAFCLRCGARLGAPELGAGRPAQVKTIDLGLAGQVPLETAEAAGLPATSVTNQPLTAGAQLAGRYDILRALKAGGMGAVYLAIDRTQPDRPCAIKEMLDRFTTQDEREEGEDWFRREATMLANLQHRSIPQIYDYFIERGRYYLAMEFVDGESLEELLARQGHRGLPEQLVLSLASQICEVVHYLHSQTPPVIFRDLKPANVMLARGGQIRLVDFGIARTFFGVRGNSLVGTPGYAPVEQYQGLTDELSDLYSLGATLHHLLTGIDPRNEPPFSFRPIRAYVPSLTLATERLLEGVLRKDPADRGPGLEEFGRQLRRVESDLSLGIVPVVMETLAIRAPGGVMPPTRMVVPPLGVDFGRRSRGERCTRDFPISNDGKTELRVVLRANVSWLHPPAGQLRVPPGSLVRVPLQIDTAGLESGILKGRLELDGNGGVESVPVQVEVGSWWLVNGMGALAVVSVCLVIVLVVVVRVLLSLT